MIWDKAMECMDREELQGLQRKRLQKIVKRVYHNVPFYRRKMQNIGIEPEDIHGLEDLEKLPFTTKADIRDNYPFGLLAVPRQNIVRFHASGGKPGKATVVGYTGQDMEIWGECMARTLAMAGMDREDILQMAYGYGVFAGETGIYHGAEKLGAAVIPMPTGNVKRLVTMMEDMGVTAIASTPSYLLHIAQTMEECGKVGKSRLKTAVCGAEPWTESMRRQIEGQLHIRAHDMYEMSEIMGPGVACDCECHQGLHVYADHFLPEIINPDTLRPVAAGSAGELVLTTITKEGLPLLRYRTRDMTAITHETCACGRTLPRIRRFMGRCDDMLIIRGVSVFPSQIESVLLEIGGTTPHYRIIVDRVNHLDTLEVQVEIGDGFFSDEIKGLESLAGEIGRVLQQEIGLLAKVKLLEPRSIARSVEKAVRVIDNRNLT